MAYDTFDAACRAADAKHKRDPDHDRLRALMEDDISLAGAQAALWRERPTSKATIDAIKIAVREHTLEEPSTKRRLQTCDAAALADIDRFIVEISEWPTLKARPFAGR